MRPHRYASWILRAIDYTLVAFQNLYCFLDDIIIYGVWSESDHINYVIKCLKKLNEDNLGIDLQKCFGYKINRTGISLLECKTAAILAIPPPTTIKCLRLFHCSVP